MRLHKHTAHKLIGDHQQLANLYGSTIGISLSHKLQYLYTPVTISWHVKANVCVWDNNIQCYSCPFLNARSTSKGRSKFACMAAIGSDATITSLCPFIQHLEQLRKISRILQLHNKSTLHVRTHCEVSWNWLIGHWIILVDTQFLSCPMCIKEGWGNMLELYGLKLTTFIRSGIVNVHNMTSRQSFVH